MLATIIRILLTTLLKVKPEEWRQVIDWVVEAEHAVVGGGFKRSYVATKIKEAWPKLALWVCDALIGLAVGYAGKKGWINLGDNK